MPQISHADLHAHIMAMAKKLDLRLDETVVHSSLFQPDTAYAHIEPGSIEFSITIANTGLPLESLNRSIFHQFGHLKEMQEVPFPDALSLARVGLHTHDFRFWFLVRDLMAKCDLADQFIPPVEFERTFRHHPLPAPA